MIITKSWSHGDCGRPILTFTFEESDDIAALDYGYPQNVYESYNWFTFPYCNLFLETKEGHNILYNADDVMVEYEDESVYIKPRCSSSSIILIIPIKFFDSIHWRRTYRINSELELYLMKENETLIVERNLYSHLQADFLKKIASAIIEKKEIVEKEKVIHFLDYVKEVFEREISVLERIIERGEVVVDWGVRYLLADEEIDMFKDYRSEFKHGIMEIENYLNNDTLSIEEVEQFTSTIEE